MIIPTKDELLDYYQQETTRLRELLKSLQRSFGINDGDIYGDQHPEQPRTATDKYQKGNF